MVKQKNVLVEVNGVALQWDETSRRAEQPCVTCKKPTRGRTFEAGKRPTPQCLHCAMDGALKAAFGPIRKAFAEAMR